MPLWGYENILTSRNPAIRNFTLIMVLWRCLSLRYRVLCPALSDLYNHDNGSLNTPLYVLQGLFRKNLTRDCSPITVAFFIDNAFFTIRLIYT